MKSIIDSIPEKWRGFLDVSGPRPRLAVGVLIAWLYEERPGWGVRLSCERLPALGVDMVRAEVVDEHGAVRGSGYAVVSDLGALGIAQADALTVAIQFAGIGSLLHDTGRPGVFDEVSARDFGISRTYDEVAERFGKVDAIVEQMGGGPRRQKFLWATYRRFQMALPMDPLTALEEFIECAEREGLRYTDLAAFVPVWLSRRLSATSEVSKEIIGHSALLEAIGISDSTNPG